MSPSSVEVKYMAKGTASTVPKGSLAEIVDPREGYAERYGETVIRVTNTDYLDVVLDMPSCYWSTECGTDGHRSGVWEQIPYGTIGLFLGSVFINNTKYKQAIHRVILLEKSVYIVPANCVKWIQNSVRAHE